jgi:cytochrome c oxidase subunit III
MAHVVLGLLIWLTVLAWARLGYLGPGKNLPVQIASVYWHFVDAVWVAVFTTYYLTPYMR